MPLRKRPQIQSLLRKSHELGWSSCPWQTDGKCCFCIYFALNGYSAAVRFYNRFNNCEAKPALVAAVGSCFLSPIKTLKH